IGTYTQQLDLAGYKKLLLLIAAAAYVKPVNITTSGYVQGVNNNSIDGNLATYSTPSATLSGGAGDIIVDWGNSAIRAVQVSMGGFITGGATITYFYSNDGITYYAYNLGTQQNLRYIKMHIVDGNQPQVYSFNLYEIYDGNTFGGTAAISFEAYEPSSGQWIEIISSGSIGTVSQGQAVSKQLGDTMVSTNLNNILSSNYAGLRIKLTITNGPIQNAVSVQRLA
ncbi:MAG: hypothetical protein KGL95_05980, partial [Patescibacteria group bacterium]|nr:hypothetical protein [Patescibacteria group bacterium]